MTVTADNLCFRDYLPYANDLKYVVDETRENPIVQVPGPGIATLDPRVQYRGQGDQLGTLLERSRQATKAALFHPRTRTRASSVLAELRRLEPAWQRCAMLLAIVA